MSTYERFFLKSKRLNSAKPIALVKGESFVGFINQLVNDVSMDPEYKAFLICSLSGGLRVEEGLKLVKNSFMKLDGALYFEVNVLKKRREDKRWARVHPAGQALVEKVLAEKIGPLFDWSQSTCLKRVKRYFPVEGMCSHSFRHSAVSYFLFVENMSAEATGKLIHINSKIVDTYAHLDERALLCKMFKS